MTISPPTADRPAPAAPRRRRWLRRLVAVAAVGGLAPLLAHLAIGPLTRIDPPTAETPRFTVEERAGVRRAGGGWTAVRGVRLVHLAGTPEEIGAQHSALLRDRMIEDERVLWDGFAELVPSSLARALVFDIGRVQHRRVSENFPPARRLEIGAQANAFAPDPYASLLPTYQRMVTLHALYDIALGFERSPLLACTAFGVGPAETVDGHALFARAFDFEAAEAFDADKAVFLVKERGAIPFASVAWPGFIGVVTGMNAAGVALAVHGGRAREPSTTGTPVPFSLREALSRARTTADAVALLEAEEVMVSHIVFVGDAGGDFAVVERAPGVRAAVRRARAVTNHFEGPLAADPKNAEVRRSTTTVERRTRIDQLLGEVGPRSATPASALAMLRDHTCASGPCPVGDRRAIDAFIATHGIVADLTTRELWVSEGPRLSGRFVKVDLSRVEDGPGEAPLEELPADPALEDGRYVEGRARAGGPLLGQKRGASR